MNTLQGHLLIAVPHLPDANFFRSVVLVIQHDDEGASGLVLNRPSNLSLNDIWSQVADGTPQRDLAINIGGPVDGPLMALHDMSDYSENEVIPSVHLSMQRENLDYLVTHSQGRIKFFSGYSGWGPGQLENELRVGGWLTASANADEIYEDPDSLWESVCEKVGQSILFDRFDPARIPDDPSVN